MKVVDVRLALEDTSTVENMLDGLAMETEGEVLGWAVLSSDGFGRLSAQLTGAVNYIQGPPDERKRVWDALATGE